MKQFKLLFSLVVLTNFANSQTTKNSSSTDLNQFFTKTGVIIYYPFDGDTKEKVSNTLSKNANLTYAENVDGKANSAAYFNGYSSYIDIGKIPNYENMTISFWMKTNQQKCSNPIFTGRHHDNEVSLTITDMPTGGLGFGPDGPGHAIRLTSDSRVNDNQWHLITCTKNGSSFAVYIDGTEVEKTYYDNMNLSKDLDFQIGHHSSWAASANSGNCPGWYEGYLDEFIVVNRQVTDDEIASLYKDKKFAQKTKSYANVHSSSDNNSMTIESDNMTTGKALSQVFGLFRILANSIPSISDNSGTSSSSSSSNCNFTVKKWEPEYKTATYTDGANNYNFKWTYESNDGGYYSIFIPIYGTYYYHLKDGKVKASGFGETEFATASTIKEAIESILKHICK